LPLSVTASVASGIDEVVKLAKDFEPEYNGGYATEETAAAMFAQRPVFGCFSLASQSFTVSVNSSVVLPA